MNKSMNANQGIIKFENSRHHRQVLRQQIKPQLLRQLEMSRNPAGNYMNAYKKIYKDELQKAIQYQNNKKQRDDLNITSHNTNHSMHKRLGSINQSIYSQANHTISNYISGPVSPSHYTSQPVSPVKYRDYFQQKSNIIAHHINTNFNGGQSFFKEQDHYRQRKLIEQKNFQQVLKKQILDKESLKTHLKQKENYNNLIMRQNIQLQKDTQRKNIQYQRNFKKYQCSQRIQQIKNEKIRKDRRSNFQLNTIAMHNPITNPIEYHIDNPYLLKNIQDNAGI